MKLKSLSLLFVIFTIGILFSVIKSQCDCGIIFPDSAYKKFDFIFVGKILGVEKDNNAYRYTVQVEENFRGVKEDEILTIYNEIGSCNVGMDVGSSYPIFLYKDTTTNNLKMIGCSRTSQTINWHRVYVEYFRLMKAKEETGGILMGTVVKITDNQARLNKPELIEKVFAENENGETFESEIEDDGFYKFINLKEGTYKVYIKLPEEFTTYGDANGFSQLGKVRNNIKISDEKPAFQDFSIITNGIISGKVLDQNGLPVGKINVTLLFMDGNGSRFPIETDDNGKYVFKGIPKGRYIIKVSSDERYFDTSSKETAFPTAFFPNVSHQNKAEIIELKQSEILENKNITLLSRLKKRLIKGQVVLENNDIPKNVSINVQIKRTEKDKIYSSGWYVITETDSNGNFSFYAYENTEYLIQAEIDRKIEDVLYETLYSSKCFVLAKKGKVKPLKIKLQKGEIECDEEKFGF